MQYLSTRNNSLEESFSTILFQGLSKDGGLFLPHTWPIISTKNLKGRNYHEVAHAVIQPFINDNSSMYNRHYEDLRNSLANNATINCLNII